MSTRKDRPETLIHTLYVKFPWIFATDSMLQDFEL